MAALDTQYSVISGNSPIEFAQELGKATADGWKPILLTSAIIENALAPMK